MRWTLVLNLVLLAATTAMAKPQYYPKQYSKRQVSSGISKALYVVDASMTPPVFAIPVDANTGALSMPDISQFHEQPNAPTIATNATGQPVKADPFFSQGAVRVYGDVSFILE
jgi:hypothetical protein